MKRTITSMVAALAMTLCFSSCCNSDPTLTASKAKSLVQKEMKRTNANVGYAQVPIGYFECNDNDLRYVLRQLAACEVITYSCERIQKQDRVRKSRRVQRGYYYSYYDTEYYWANDTVTTYFVATALTDKGQKMVVDSEFEVKPTADEKELRLDFQPELDKFPESSVDYREFPEISAKEEPVEVEEEVTDFSSSAVYDDDPSSAWQRAKNKENVVLMTVKSYKVKIVKARNIIVTQVPTPIAQAQILLEYTDVTPFGRIIGKVYNGQRKLLEEVNFVYYQDKNWVLKDID